MNQSSLKLYIGFYFIILVDCLTREKRQEQCSTSENFEGYCIKLSNCPYFISLYNQYNETNQFQQYFLNSKNACTNIIVGGDPVIYCKQSNERTTNNIMIEKDNSCQSPDGLSGKCLNLKKCPSLFKKIEQNTQDTQYGQFLRDSNAVCNLPAPIVCCPNIITDRLPTQADECGVVASQLFKKVLGGQPAKIGDWPWIALLGYTESNGERVFKCGGALITSKHILTAAHCIKSNLTFVRLGEHDLKNETETQYMDIDVEKTYVHSKYDRLDRHSDIAVLRLRQNAPYNNFIRYACLPHESSLKTKSYVDLNPFAAGWGLLSEGGKSAHVLQEIQIPVRPNKDCASSFKARNAVQSTKQFDDAVLCAGSFNRWERYVSRRFWWTFSLARD